MSDRLVTRAAQEQSTKWYRYVILGIFINDARIYGRPDVLLWCITTPDLFQTSTAEHALVYWPEEDCVSVVSFRKVVEPMFSQREQALYSPDWQETLTVVLPLWLSLREG